MQSTEYKVICQKPNAFQRLTLEETIRILRSAEPELAHRLEREMNNPPVPKPVEHQGDRTTDFFRVSVSVADAEAIVDACMWEEVGAVSPEGGTTAAASHYASLVDRWTHYRAWLEDGTV